MRGRWLRRSILVAAAVLPALLPAPARAVGVDAGAAAGQIALADWIVFTGKNSAVYYFAGAYRGLDSSEGLVEVGFVGRGTCEMGRHVIVCSGRGRARPISMEDFEVDPLLASARLTVETPRYTHTVAWTGKGRAPLPEAGLLFGSYGVMGGGGAVRNAAARATLFGTELPARGSFGLLATGGGGGVIVYEDSGVVVGEDGTVTVWRRFRF